MALLTLSEYYATVGVTTSDATRDAATQTYIDQANDAIIRYLHNGIIERKTYTIIMPAPVSLKLVVPVVPVRVADALIYLNTNAQGDPAAFTSDNLLVPFRDYVWETGPYDALNSNSGIVRNLSAAWGVWYQRPALSLASQLVPVPGAIKLVFSAGYDTVPPSIQAAATLIVTRLYNMRKIGFPMISESLQSYSFSGQSTATADGIIEGDPTIRALLRPFGRSIQVGSCY